MSYQLCAIGNALVDVTVSVSDDFLKSRDLAKGGMFLVEDAVWRSIYDSAGTAVEMTSGGSAANTLAGFTSLGGTGAFTGKVASDQFGDAFAHDLHAQKIHYATARSTDFSTGRCLVLVTPDAQRTMVVYLGAATQLGPDDIDAGIVQNSEITYLEGYAFDTPPNKEAFRRAAALAHQAGRKLALSLSDLFCVARHRAAFRAMVEQEVDILFANQAELLALYETENEQEAITAVSKHVSIAVTTRSEKGAIIASGKEHVEVPAHPVGQVIDTTGAGDLYAAGFLFGLARGKPLPECGRIGAIAAAEVISHYGPRPQKKLIDLI
jgi:sugar/nucleoside kinase (ribokinase family)